MSFNPLNVPPGSGPSLEGKPGQPWYRRWFLWIVVLGVAAGALVFGR